MSEERYIYGAREIATGKLVSYITSQGRKYWDSEMYAKQAINRHNGWCRRSNYDEEVELVKFKLVEVATNNGEN